MTRDLCYSFESSIISIDWAKNLIELKIFANQRFNLFKSDKGTSVLLIWIYKNWNWMKKRFHYYEVGKFPKFHYFDGFLLNRKMLIGKLSTNTGFSTILWGSTVHVVYTKLLPIFQIPEIQWITLYKFYWFLTKSCWDIGLQIDVRFAVACGIHQIFDHF